MRDRSALLDELRLDRGEPDVQPRKRVHWWLLAAAIVAAAAGVGWWRLGPQPLVVAAAVAEPAPTEGAAPAPAASILDASGYVVARRAATVSAKVTGKVAAVLIEEGQRVERGDIIARLDDSNARAALAQAEAQRDQALASLAAARSALENARPLFARNERQYALRVISAQSFDLAKAEYDAAEANLAVAQRAVEVAEANVLAARQNLEDTIVRAPFAGVVTVKAAQEGEMVSPISAGGGFTRTGIGTIVDMDSLEVEVDVSESFINRVRPGQEAVLQLNAYPDWHIPARVIAIVPTADRAKATVKVRVGFDERDPRILPQMGVRVSFLGDAEATAPAAAAAAPVLLPTEAVQVNGSTGVVFLIRNDDTLERRAVRLGPRVGERQVVLSGLTAGTRVAVGDLASLADGLRVRLAN
ncbi:MAG TPA: efflux RND transporter periplasmic adaptor subunit [Gammaproteobacteria bacterium]